MSDEPSGNEPDVPGATTGFIRDIQIEDPAIVGARWWHQSLIEQDAAIRRRAVLKGVALAGGVVGAITLLGVGISKLAAQAGSGSELRDALAMQKQYGWDFGARGVHMVYDGVAKTPFDRAALHRLPAALRSPHFGSLQVTTLLESLEASPTEVLANPRTDDDDFGPGPDPAATSFQRLVDVIVPYESTAMRRAYLAGEALARLAWGRDAAAAVLVDLPGALATAFAAGACAVFEPVTLFDNWPHPRGVVASHMTLAALAYYQPRFVKQATERPLHGLMPLFVIDRDRTAPYSEESDRFDNRYFARMPSADALKRLGVKHLFYVMPKTSDLPEPDDLNEALSGMAPDIESRPLALSEFDGVLDGAVDLERGGPPGDVGGFHYGGSLATDLALWTNYPWLPPPPPEPAREVVSSTKSYSFVRRAAATTKPTGQFGKVAVLVTGGVIVGSLLRRGSMNRASGGWGG